MAHDDPTAGASRRDLLRAVGAVAIGSGVGMEMQGATAAAAPGGRTNAYNILFILVDQERRFRPGELPAGFRLPAHERLMKQGTRS